MMISRIAHSSLSANGPFTRFVTPSHYPAFRRRPAVRVVPKIIVAVALMVVTPNAAEFKNRQISRNRVARNSYRYVICVDVLNAAYKAGFRRTDDNHRFRFRRSTDMRFRSPLEQSPS